MPFPQLYVYLDSSAYWNWGTGVHQGQVGQVLEQPGVVEDVCARDGGLELDGLQGPFQHKAFCDSMFGK